MRCRKWVLVLAAEILLMQPLGQAVAQFRGGPEGGGPPWGGDFRQRMLERMDANGNGVLEPGEVSDRARGFIDRMAREGGLDPGRPMPLSRLAQGGGGGDGGDRRGRDGRDGRDGRNRRDGRDDDRRGSSDSTDQQLYPLIPNFGDPVVPAFGVNPLSLNGRIIDLESRYDRRILERVDRTMSRYDRNENGLLDYSEWGAVSWRGEDPRESDLDGDGRLTKAELAEQLAVRSRREDDERRRRGGLRSGGPSREGDSRGSRAGDGQRGGGDRRENERGGPFGRGRFDPTAMLSGFDRDGDGVITPEELGERRQFAGRFLERFGMDAEQPIRLDELRERSQQQSRGGTGNEASKEKPDPAAVGQSYRVDSSVRFKDRRSYRYVAAPLPNNLPEWWKGRDGDENGQVTMAEFLNAQSRPSTDEFSKYDFNGDGIITAREASLVQSEK